jgi:hypothetical protein
MTAYKINTVAHSRNPSPTTPIGQIADPVERMALSYIESAVRYECMVQGDPKNDAEWQAKSDEFRAKADRLLGLL